MPAPCSVPEAKSLYIRGTLLILCIFSLLVVLTLWIENNDWDRKLSALFYLQDAAATTLPSGANRWFLADQQPWKALYKYGPLPGIFLTLFSLFAWYRSFKTPQFASLRPYLLVFGFTGILGAGIIVNAVLKEHTGRPRPREITEFHGKWDYKPVFKLGIPGRGRSFSCGHCTMGFIFTGGVIFWRRSRKFAIASLVGGLGYGVLMSLTRIVQGGHFLSDTMWTLGILWMTLSVLYYFVFQPPITDSRPHQALTSTQKRKIWAGVALFFAVLFALYATRRPFYKDHRYSVEVSPEVTQLEVRTNLQWNQVQLHFEEGRNSIATQSEAQGFAWMKGKYRLKANSSVTKQHLILEYQIQKKGRFLKLLENTHFWLPQRFKGNIKVSLPPE